MKPTTPEGLVKSGVIRYLRMCGWYVEINVQGAYTRGRASGRPDIEATKRGVTVRIEVKAPAHRGPNGRWYQEGQLSPNQVKYIAELERHGAVVIVTADAERFADNLDDLEAQLWPQEGQVKRRLV
jgi:hypothetical protein